MNRRNARSAAAVAVALLAISSIAGVRSTAGDDATRAAIAIGTGSELTITGTSTMHDWESKTSVITMTFTRAPGQADPADAAGIAALVKSSGIATADVDLPVAKFHSHKDGLDKNMMKSLKSDQFPSITFHMDRYAVAGPATGDTISLTADGTLTVCGKPKKLTLAAKAWMSDKGLWVAGSQPLNMTDFGVKPPTMMMGAIKTGDRVVIHYQLLLAPAALPTGSAAQTEK